jgi:hypothetical protein
MSQLGGGLSNRFSNSTATTPVDINELSSGKGSMHQRRYPQNQESEVCVSRLHIALVLLDRARLIPHAHGVNSTLQIIMSPTLDRPYEMPAEHYYFTE